jgi:hypothetical protein
MATNALRQAPGADIAIAGTAIVAQAVEDNALAVLHDGFAFVFAVSLHRHLCSCLTVRAY